MHPTEDNVEIQPENEFCQSHYMNIFVGSIYAYKGLLMVILLAATFFLSIKKSKFPAIFK